MDFVNLWEKKNQGWKNTKICVKEFAEKRRDEAKKRKEKICLNNWNEVAKDFIRFFYLKRKDTLIECGVNI